VIVSLEFHDIANSYPLMEGQEFDDLCKDIAEKGLLESIWLYEGKILDGRNRYKAAIEAGVEPVIVEFSGDDPLEFVVHANSNRRDLGIGQRAAIGIKIQKYWNEKGKENMSAGGGDRKSDNKKSGLSDLTNPVNAREEAAKAVGVSEGTMEVVSKLEKEEPELFEQVASGKLTPHKAQKKAKERKKKEQRAQIVALGAAVEPSDRWHVWQARVSLYPWG